MSDEDNQYPEAEAKRRFEAALRGALRVPNGEVPARKAPTTGTHAGKPSTSTASSRATRRGQQSKTNPA
jgi:hypothetical protein